MVIMLALRMMDIRVVMRMETRLLRLLSLRHPHACG